MIATLAVSTSIGSAHAISVSVDGTTYGITTFTGTYDSNLSRFTDDEMPWFGSASLASALATQVGDQLGLPNSGAGPLFAWLPKLWYGVPVIFYIDSYPFLNNGTHPGDWVATYAVASSQPPSPVPGPLPLFGAAAAFGASRRLRRRIELRS